MLNESKYYYSRKYPSSHEAESWLCLMCSTTCSHYATSTANFQANFHKLFMITTRRERKTSFLSFLKAPIFWLSWHFAIVMKIFISLLRKPRLREAKALLNAIVSYWNVPNTQRIALSVLKLALQKFSSLLIMHLGKVIIVFVPHTWLKHSKYAFLKFYDVT